MLYDQIPTLHYPIFFPSLLILFLSTLPVPALFPPAQHAARSATCFPSQDSFPDNLSNYANSIGSFASFVHHPWPPSALWSHSFHPLAAPFVPILYRPLVAMLPSHSLLLQSQVSPLPVPRCSEGQVFKYFIPTASFWGWSVSRLSSPLLLCVLGPSPYVALQSLQILP